MAKPLKVNMKNYILHISVFLQTIYLLIGCSLSSVEPTANIQITENRPTSTFFDLEETLISQSSDIQFMLTSEANRTYVPEEITQAAEMALTQTAGFTPRPTYTPAFGIFTSGPYFEDMNIPRNISTKTIWQGQVNNQIIRIYTGKSFPDPRLGAGQEITNYGVLELRIYEIEHPLPSQIEQYTTTDEVGHIQIENIEGTRLTLTASNYLSSTTTPIPFYFDVVARQFEGIAGGLTFPEPTPAADSYP
jgi:hypothetical protein